MKEILDNLPVLIFEIVAGIATPIPETQLAVDFWRARKLPVKLLLFFEWRVTAEEPEDVQYVVLFGRVGLDTNLHIARYGDPDQCVIRCCYGCRYRRDDSPSHRPLGGGEITEEGMLAGESEHFGIIEEQYKELVRRVLRVR
ncbi:hypothetical protein HY624_00755 [Candidatus Uhrbacteria bacterium]|nr:hypothetical protein [Candidatus Uhrbacteria bacterium]